MDPAPHEPRREHAGGVLGVAFGLVLLLVCLGTLIARLFGGAVDGQARVAELFGAEPPPFGLVLADARRLSTGDLIVRLARPEDAGADASVPEEVIFIQYRSAAAVAPLFHPTPELEGSASGRKLEWEKKKDFAWHFTFKKDEIAWGPWRSTLLVERSFSKGGGWRDEARVDLSRKDRPLVLFAHWPVEKAADEVRLKELLGALAVAGEEEGAERQE